MDQMKQMSNDYHGQNTMLPNINQPNVRSMGRNTQTQSNMTVDEGTVSSYQQREKKDFFKLGMNPLVQREQADIVLKKLYAN
jgi:hypothetical protein